MAEYDKISIIPSADRMQWLKKTIELVQENGIVYLCRIPVSVEMRNWEDKMWPAFDEDLAELAHECSVNYISYYSSAGKFMTTDGNHLFKDDGRKFTVSLCDSIAKYSNLCKESR